MNTFKQAMVFLILAAAVWLLWQRRADGELVVWTVAFSLSVALGVWWYGRWTRVDAAAVKRWAAPIVAALLVTLGAYVCFGVMYTPATKQARVDGEKAIEPWQPYSREKLDAHLAKGNIVIVDWTAEW